MLKGKGQQNLNTQISSLWRWCWL